MAFSPILRRLNNLPRRALSTAGNNVEVYGGLKDQEYVPLLHFDGATIIFILTVFASYQPYFHKHLRATRLEDQ